MQIIGTVLFVTAFVIDNALYGDSSAFPSFKDQCLKWHNIYRELHQVQNVTWNESLAADAESWANHLAINNMFEHAKNIWEGENLYLSGSPLPKEPCTEATQLFYGEIENYDFSKPVFSWKTGHFTQVVWKNTKEIGAAKRIRNDSKLVVVIRYFPPGNLLSQEAFKKNVLPIPGEGRGGAFERCASLAFTGFVWVVGTCGQFIF